MKSILIAISIILFVVHFSHSQTLPQPLPNLKSGWLRVIIEDVGSIDIPATLEVQSSEHKQQKSDFLKETDSNAQFIAQQKGLNEMTNEGFDKFARVIIKTKMGASDEFEKLTFDISQITNSQMDDINKSSKLQIERNFIKTGINLLEWFPIKLEKVNGMSCIHISYVRQLNDNPRVLVHTYNFPNYDRMHYLTLEYRLSESDYWKSDFENVLKTFRISNIK